MWTRWTRPRRGHGRAEGAWPRAAPPPPPSRPAPHSTPGTPSQAAPSATLPALPMLPGRCPLGGLCGDLAPEARGSPQASLSVPVPMPGHVAAARVRRDGFPALRPPPPPRAPTTWPGPRPRPAGPLAPCRPQSPAAAPPQPACRSRACRPADRSTSRAASCPWPAPFAGAGRFAFGSLPSSVLDFSDVAVRAPGASSVRRSRGFENPCGRRPPVPDPSSF